MRWTSLVIVCVCLVAVLVVCEPDDKLSEKTKILKCCKHGEELTKPLADGSTHCVASSVPWKPFIYSPRLNDVVPNVPENWDVIESQRPQCQKSNHVVTYVPYSQYSPFILLDIGLAILEPGTGPEFQPGEYCADTKALLVCAPQKIEANRAAATMRPKIRRCCGENAAFHENKQTCVVQKESPDAPVLLPNASSIVELIFGFPHCQEPDNFRIVGSAKDALVQPDGGLEVSGVVLPAEQFCIERIKELDGVPKVFVCREHAPQRPVVEKMDIRFTLYPVSLIISAIFLAATLAAGWLLPASHHVLHWRCQTHHVVCLMFGNILMAIIQLASHSLDGGTCKAVAILAHFFFLAAFFWLNTMCFNIWWTFRDLRPASLEKGQETLRLRVYACYAWGGPLLVAGLAALLDHLPPQPHYTFLRPRFGEKQCWFYVSCTNCNKKTVPPQHHYTFLRSRFGEKQCSFYVSCTNCNKKTVPPQHHYTFLKPRFGEKQCSFYVSCTNCNKKTVPPQAHYTFLKPRFGEKQCSFYGETEILAYFYGPIGVLLIVNVMFFIATARELTCGLWKGEFVKSTTERAALGRVCMKLVIVMGVTWIADIVSWLVGGPHYVWYFTDLVNALQGVFIFIVVGWQPQVRAGLKRLINRNPRANAGRQGNGLSTTSHGMPSMGDSVTQNPSTKTAPLETIC